MSPGQPILRLGSNVYGLEDISINIVVKTFYNQKLA